MPLPQPGLPVDGSFADGCERSLSLGNVDVAICSSDDGWLEQVSVRYGGFLVAGMPAPGAIRLDYHVEGEEEPSPEALRDARLGGLQSQAVEGTMAGACVEFRGVGFRAFWQLAAGHLEIWGPRAVYPMDLLLQALWYGCHPHALIVHATALSDGTSGWLCAGASGSGKSTLAALLPERAMADELVGVLVEAGPSELVALPFWTARPARVPLCAVHCLRHRQDIEIPDGGPHLRRRLGVPEALQHLRRQIAWPTWDAAAMARCLETLGRVLEMVPVYELAFSPRAGVWPHVIECEEALA